CFSAGQMFPAISKRMKRIVIYCLSALLCFATTYPCAAADTKVKVYMLSGILNISSGLRELAAKLAQRGIAATVYQSEDVDLVSEVIMGDYRTQKVHRIVLVGYSAGAGAAVLIAERLNQVQIPITLMVTLDPVAEFTVPRNVKRAVNFYARN